MANFSFAPTTPAGSKTPFSLNSPPPANPSFGSPTPSAFNFGTPTVVKAPVFGTTTPQTGTVGGFGTPSTALTTGSFGATPSTGASNFNFSSPGGQKPAFGASGTTNTFTGMATGGMTGFGSNNQQGAIPQITLPVKYPVRVRATGAMKDLPQTSQPGEPLSRQAFHHCFDLKYEHKQAIRKVNAKLNEIQEKMPVIATDLRNLKAEVRGAVERHAAAHIEEEALLKDVRWVFHTARGVVVEERSNPREIPHAFFGELLARLEERQIAYDHQICKLRDIVEVRRHNVYAQQTPFGQRRALPASVVGDVISSQNLHITALADKLASLHERIDFLRQRAREQATRKGEIDPFLQADREEHLKQQHESRLIVEEELNNSNSQTTPATSSGFGAPAAGGFGSPATGGFGAKPATGGFGTPAAGGFGSPATGGFGAKPATGGFGTPAAGGFGSPATGGFGAKPATGGFGAPAAGGFGSPATGGFGAKPATGGFGAPATGGFGSPATGGFGAKPATSGFGAPAAGGFGSPATGGFGAKPATGGFGAPAAGGFGSPAAGGFGTPGAFGASAGQTGGSVPVRRKSSARGIRK